MQVQKKDKETSQQTARKFNRLVAEAKLVEKVRALKNFVKPATRADIKRKAVRRLKLNQGRLWY